MSQDWTPSASPELRAVVGLTGRVQRVELSEERRTTLRRTVGEEFYDETTTLADFCPDPLVLALDSGLPRSARLGHIVDGGSEWEQLAPLSPGVLTAVSRITEVVERTSSSGRRMSRTCYETTFHDGRGAHVGTTRGFGLDVEGATPADGGAS